MDTQRLDKWLWCARFFKTRNIAADAIKTGRIAVNGARVKPAKEIRIGDRLSVRQPPYEFVISVLDLSSQRGSANDAQQLYAETEASIEQRNALKLQPKAQADALPRSGGKLTTTATCARRA